MKIWPLPKAHGPSVPSPLTREYAAEALSYPMGSRFPPRQKFFSLDDELLIPLNLVLQLRHDLFHGARVWRLQRLLLVVNHGEDAIV